MKKKLGILSLTALSLVLAACGNGGTTTDNEEAAKSIKVTVNGELASLDSISSTDSPSQNTIANVMEGLYRPADKGSNELGIAAEEPTVSEDGLTYTFTIRDDADWSNGDPVTAEDFRKSSPHWKMIISRPQRLLSCCLIPGFVAVA